MDKKKVGYAVAGLLAVGLVVWFVIPKEKSCAELQREINVIKLKMDTVTNETDLEKLRSEGLSKAYEIKRRLLNGDKNCNP